MMPTASKDIIVINSAGFHARPVMEFVDLASRFSSEIRVRKGGENPVVANGRSVMEMITLEAGPGVALKIEASGDDAEEAVKKLAELFENKFGEE